MAYRPGDFPEYENPPLPSYPSTNPGHTDRGTDPTRPAVSKPKSLLPKPTKSGSKPKPPKPGEDTTPYTAYIEELRKLKQEELARQQAEADRIRQAYAAYAAYLGALPGQIQGLYSDAASDQAQFAKGFSGGLQETASSVAAEVNAQLAKIGSPEGQQIDPSLGEKAGNVLYGVQGYIPGQELTTSGAAFASAAAFMGPNALRQGELDSQKYTREAAESLGEYDLEIAKAVGEEAQFRAEEKARQAEAKAKNAALLKDEAVDLYNSGLITQREFARRMGLKNWRTYPKVPKPGEAAGIDAAASKLVGYLVDDNGNPIRDRKGKPIPILSEPEEVELPRVNTTLSAANGYLTDSYGRPILDPKGNTQPYKPYRDPKSGSNKKGYWTQGPDGWWWVPADGSPPVRGESTGGGNNADFKKNASEARELAGQAMKGRKVGKNITGTRDVYEPFKSWQAAIDWMISEGADPDFAAWALWSKGGRKLKGAPKRRPPAPKASAAPSGGDYSGVPTGLTPSPHQAYAIKMANKYNIPVGIFLSLIQHESEWDVDIVSPAGAKGLTQLIGKTNQPFNPRINLEVGARYLAQQFRRFGSWDLALAAYNAGPNAVAKYGGIPPYKETQAYVRNVIATASSGSAPSSNVAWGGDPTVSPVINNAINFAMQQVGQKYVWGGESRREGGFDCSGLLDWAFMQAGINFPDRLTTYSKVGRPVSLNSLRPGDFIYSNNGKHMTMYIGNGKVIAASSARGRVTVMSIRDLGRLVGARRLDFSGNA